MKTLKKILAFLPVLILFATISASACDIDFNVIEGSKDKYKNGDVVTIKATVQLVHRSCHTDINQTKLTPNGMNIKSATKWVEKSPGLWERKLKVKINNPKNNKATLKLVRTCDRDGGNGTITLKTA